MSQRIAAIEDCHNLGDHSYIDFVRRLTDRLIRSTNSGERPLFRTAGTDVLWDVYLDSFDDPMERQYHNCSACRRFIQEFGGLVVIDEDGATRSAIWNPDDAPKRYCRAVAALADEAADLPVRSLFLSSRLVWGQPEAGGWHHFHLTPPPTLVMKPGALRAGQAMAAKLEDFRTVQRALGEFSAQDLELAVSILRTETLYRSEKVLGAAEWLRDLHHARKNAPRGRAGNVVWRAVAKAPTGFCHPRSSMIGTLLEDIKAGLPGDAIAARFAAKMAPTRYQRPQAAPAAGAIAAAEKLVERLGIAPSLERRFCRLEEALPHAIWQPSSDETPASHGVFAHLQPKGSRREAGPVEATYGLITWRKFAESVLPHASRIQLSAPEIGPYTALTTAVNADAPPILQWDSEDCRNPVALYLWNGGSYAHTFGLASGAWYDVTGIIPKPCSWHGSYDHFGEGIVLLIAEAKDRRSYGNALFPEILKSDLHPVRSVIEAYSRRATLGAIDGPHAAGLMLGKEFKRGPWSVTVQATIGGIVGTYKLDRWD